MNDYDLWFIMLNISNKNKINLIKRFKNTREIWYYTLNEDTSNYFRTKVDIKQTWNTDKIKLLRDFLVLNNIKLAFFNDELYPENLKNYYDMPFVLFYKGNISRLNERINVAIVGSRECSSYGINVTKIIAKELSANKVNIVSGLARGIDSYAHSACIENGGFTCAVLGTGIDIVYPKENRKLFNDIEKSGCIITQFLPGTKPLAYNFPNRNRIISGLSSVTAVIEAGEKSGSLITANYALEQGNDVIAVPGSVFSRTSAGTNKLINDGAYIFTEMSDIFNLIGMEYNHDENNKKIKMTPIEAKIYNILSDNPVHIDDIIKIADIDIGQIYELLFEMQLKEEIMCLSGNFYVKIKNAI